MKNIYITSYFPLFSIILFSLSLSIRLEIFLIGFLKKNGIYEGMLEFFSDGGIKIAFLVLLLTMSFMVFAAMKLIANTINDLSLLFFSKDSEGESLKQVRGGSLIYFFGGLFSLLSVFSFLGIFLIFTGSTIVYFIYFVFKVSPSLTVLGTMGLVFFQVIIWSTLLTGIFYVAVKVYNSVIASLPV